MAINITADPFVLTSEQRGVYSFNVVASPFVVTMESNQPAVSHYPPAARNAALDQTLYLSYASATDAALVCSIHGTWLNVNIQADPFVVNSSILYSGEDVAGEVWAADPFVLTATFEEPIVILASVKSNWVKWSNIGSLDFTIWKDNVAGERPINLAGWVYGLKKLGGKIVVYSQNGIVLLVPSGVYWGEQIISRIGVRSKQAFCGNDQVQFYVDIEGRLCKVSDAIEVLDYSEYIDSMLADIVLSFDEVTQRVYICDGLVGYVYDLASKSFAEGPANITGIGSQSGTSYVTASGAISIPAFSLCTDIYDMGNRKPKTIHYLDIGTDLTTGLYAAIDYRLDKSVAFATSPWTTVNPNGRANLPCFGVEFRFRLKTLTYEYFELDYIRAVGMLHDYSWLDSFSSKG